MSENTRVAAIMVNDNAQLSGNTITAGNVIGQVGTFTGQITGRADELSSKTIDAKKGAFTGN